MRALLVCFLTIIPLLSLPGFRSPAYANPDQTRDSGMVRVPSGTMVRALTKKKVAVDAFFIDRYEVTQEEYQQVMGENPSFFKGARRPVEKVTWDQADTYCRKAGKRLPTEWEWELAARAGSDTLFYWGDAHDRADAHAWHSKNSGKQSHPVGEKKPNAYGLYDMAGNVWEWTASDHESGGKVLRGGSWRNSVLSLRSRHRILSNPIYRYHYVGFRCARPLPGEGTG